jgi:hypothetical protein
MASIGKFIRELRSDAQVAALIVTRENPASIFHAIRTGRGCRRLIVNRESVPIAGGVLVFDIASPAVPVAGSGSRGSIRLRVPSIFANEIRLNDSREPNHSELAVHHIPQFRATCESGIAVGTQSAEVRELASAQLSAASAAWGSLHSMDARRSHSAVGEMLIRITGR